MPSARQHRSERRAQRPWTRAPWIAVAVAVSTFLLALDDGTYSLSSRTSLTIAVWWIWASPGGVVAGPRSARPPRSSYLRACSAGLATWTALSAVWAADVAAAYDEVGASAPLSRRLLARRDARGAERSASLGGRDRRGHPPRRRCSPSPRGCSPTCSRSTRRYRFLSSIGSQAQLPDRLLERARDPRRAVGSVADAGCGFAERRRIVRAPRRSRRSCPSRPCSISTSSRGGVLVAVVGALAFVAFATRRWLVAAAVLAAVAACGRDGRRSCTPSPKLVNDPLRSGCGRPGPLGQRSSSAALRSAQRRGVARSALAWRLERRVPERAIVVAVAAVVVAGLVAVSARSIDCESSSNFRRA